MTALPLSAADNWVDWEWIGEHLDVILGDLAQHLELTVIAVGVGLLLALPAGSRPSSRRSS